MLLLLKLVAEPISLITTTPPLAGSVFIAEVICEGVTTKVVLLTGVTLTVAVGSPVKSMPVTDPPEKVVTAELDCPTAVQVAPLVAPVLTKEAEAPGEIW